MAKNPATLACSMLPVLSLLAPLCWSGRPAQAMAGTTDLVASTDLVFEEVDGIVAVEAEHFFRQTKAAARAWHLTTATGAPSPDVPDADGPHLAGASGGAYLEALPDTRRTHDDELTAGENFSDEAGRVAVLHYKVHFNTPGRYYVWVRAHSTGTEDNGVHVGIDGDWPASGRRWQTVAKNKWTWDSRQRTEQTHTGEPHKLFLDVEGAGEHLITFSMREDGFEFDKWLMTTDRAFRPPADAGPVPRARRGAVPRPFAVPAAYQDASGAGSAAEKPAPLVRPRHPNGDGSVKVEGAMKQWHKLTLVLDGPFAHERDNAPNPFTDYRMTVTFRHASGSPAYAVPGYFAADGDAANTSAESGTRWRAHLSPDEPGRWTYVVSFVKGAGAALDPPIAGEKLAPFDGQTGAFEIAETAIDKAGRDFHHHGRLQYVGKHHLRFAGSGGYFLKAGPDSPENLLAYEDFDGTVARRRGQAARSGEAAPTGLKTWRPHLRDWKAGDPTWKDGRGKGLIGALNYLADEGCNAFSFLTYNAGGDGDDVWPMVDRADKLHYDCSKLDQWQIVFDHAQARGLYLHFKMQETENDDRKGPGADQSLDGGDLGPQRKLYCRELIARFGHALALNWNLGEENTQSPEQQRAMARYIRDTDPFDHHIVVHTYPGEQEKAYDKLIGEQSVLTGASLQNNWDVAHQRTVKWVRASAETGRPWVVASDEQGPSNLGVPPDPGYAGFDGTAGAKDGKGGYDLHGIRSATLWGNLMAGGAGVEYYFGYQLPQNDLNCEDFRSRDRSWDYCRIALAFFERNQIPFWEMADADALVGNPKHENGTFCLAKPGEVYVIYLAHGGGTDLDLSDASGTFGVRWFNPRTGGGLRQGSVRRVEAAGKVSIGQPPADPEQDWVVLLEKRAAD